jgi:RNA polymerase sigma-70 factor, ECF subfamily
VLLVSPNLWHDVDARLRPFIARRVDAQDVDDVLQDVFVRIHRGLASLRDEQRLTPWLFQIARNAIADNLRMRQRHPLATAAPDAPAPPPENLQEHLLAACIADFVARLPSPYREAVTLVELQGLTIKEAAEMSNISVSGMKSRVQRGRTQLRAAFEACCQIALDVRGKVIDVTPRATCCALSRTADRRSETSH